MLKLAHVINPVKVDESFDLHMAQPVTFETMRRAKAFAKNKIDVSLYSAQFPEDSDFVPEYFKKTKDLDRSVLDFGEFYVSRKLPLLKDILDRLYDASDAEFFIYTNVDIAVIPYFYVAIRQMIEDGYDAFAINRRTIPEHYSRIDEIPMMYWEAGLRHPGHDCFVFRRDSYPNYKLGCACIGAEWIAKILLGNMVMYSDRFMEFKDSHLTFHIGDARQWKNEKYTDYSLHNRREACEIIREFRKEFGSLNKVEPFRYLEHVEPEDPSRTQAPEKPRPDNPPKFKILHHTDRSTVEAMYREYAPVFILNTGRSGSKFLSSLLNRASNVTAHHEAKPSLQYFPDFAYRNQDRRDLLVEMIDAARMELFLEAYIRNTIYVESNHCLTFFAPAIAELFPKSKFVHITRHPGHFVRSAARHGFHKNDSVWEAGRVRMDDDQAWRNMDQLERLCWLWGATHGFIEEFKKQIEPERFVSFKIENLFDDPSQVRRLTDFIGAEAIPEGEVLEAQSTKVNELHIGVDEPPNMKKTRHFPKYPVWDEAMKGTLKKHALPLAEKYGYDLNSEKSVAEHAPLLSVIISGNGDGERLETCIESVLNQTYRRIEIIVCNNGRLDQSLDVVRHYEKKYPNKIRRASFEKHPGDNSAPNRAVRWAKGEYITFLKGADYYCDHRKLEKEMDLIFYYKEKEGKDIVSFSDAVSAPIGEPLEATRNGRKKIREGMIFKDFLTRSCAIPRNFVASWTAFLESGGGDPDLGEHGNWDLSIRLSAIREWRYTGIAGTVCSSKAIPKSDPVEILEDAGALWRIFLKNLSGVGENDRRLLMEKFGVPSSMAEKAGERDIEKLEKINEERLEVIRNYGQIAEERLDLICRLDFELKARQEVIDSLDKAAQERLDLIHMLTAELERRQKVIDELRSKPDS